jgi:hypothetical protein
LSFLFYFVQEFPVHIENEDTLSDRRIRHNYFIVITCVLDKKKACSPDRLRLTVPGLTCNDGVYCSVILRGTKRRSAPAPRAASLFRRRQRAAFRVRMASLRDAALPRFFFH